MGLGIAVAMLLISSPTSAAQPSFLGVPPGASITDVKRRFPGAQVERWPSCKPGEMVAVFGDGPSSCEHLDAGRYNLFGYDFVLSFYFYPSGGIKTISLYWPEAGTTEPSKIEAENAFWAISTQLSAKYGPPADDELAKYFPSKRRWLAPHGGKGKTLAGNITLRKDLIGKWKTVSLSYDFADAASFGRF